MATRMKSKPRDNDPNNQSRYEDEMLDDLSKLQDKSSDSIFGTLKRRYENESLTYTKVGARVLVSINPQHVNLTMQGAEYQKNYSDHYHDFSGQRPNLPSHIYGLANTALFHLKRSAIDQAVIFMGDSGSGKTNAKKLFIDQLLQLRSGSKKEAKIFKQLQNSYTVYNSFGQALTSDNTTASRFGLYTEIQFDQKGRCIGFRNLDYLLERGRVTSPLSSETNFFAFYQLLAGTSNEEKDLFHLSSDINNYAYLRGTRSVATTSQLNTDFRTLKGAMRSLGFNPKFQSQVFQLLAAVLHLGNIQFMNPNHQGGEVAIVKNFDILEIVADFLGLHASTLEGILTYKTKLIKKEACTVFLDADGSRNQRDELARCLYGLLFSWIAEHMNNRLAAKGQANFLGLLDLPGTSFGSDHQNFQQFCANYANERLYHYMCYHIFDASNDAYAEDNVYMPQVPHQNNQPTIHLLTRRTSGLVAILHRQANRNRGPTSDAALLQLMTKEQEDDENHVFTANPSMSQFTVRHFYGAVSYNVDGFMESNMAGISPDFVQVFRGQDGVATGNPFVAGLFSSSAVTVETHSQDKGAIVAAQQTGMPTRQPTMKRPRAKGDLSEGRVPCMASQLQIAMSELFDAFDDAEAWFVLCLHPGSHEINNNKLMEQVERYSLSEMAQRKSVEYTACYGHEDFTSRYGQVLGPMGVDPNRPAAQAIEAARTIFGWDSYQLAIGNQFTYLSEDAWRDLEDNLRAFEQGVNIPNIGIDDDARSCYSDDMGAGDSASIISASQVGDFKLERAANALALDDEKVEVEKEEDSKRPATKIRKGWVCCTWMLTWWIPGPFLSCCGRMKRPDVRMAWREKVALCVIILFLCLVVMAFVILFSPLVCPSQKIYAESEVQVEKADSVVLSRLYGKVYNLAKYDGFISGHYDKPRSALFEEFGGKDMANIFPQQISSLCRKYDGSQINPQVQLFNSSRDLQLTRHDHRYFVSTESSYEPNWLQGVIRNKLKKSVVGDVAYDPKFIKSQASSQNSKMWVIYREDGKTEFEAKVYDISSYFNAIIMNRDGEDKADYEERNFLHPDFLALVNARKGDDVTDVFNNQLLKGDPAAKKILKECLDNAFYAGLVDNRNSFRCQFAQKLLLIVSIFLSLIMIVKFLASLQLGSRPAPEDHDKFVICNVPCYTEDEESLLLTIESLAVLKYDDKRKLLFVIADGMVVGGGNDTPTPRIVLRILGADPDVDPEALSFLSLGEGMKQHNMGKVYTGLYECKGHIVPYLVVVKVGKPTERAKPGNRGKRDSQMILMRFFNKVHYDAPMVPLELEMYHQIKNVIGVDPHFYEFVLMVDADTKVLPDSLNRLVSALQHDTKIMGICGETALMNEKATWASMIQVYEYYLSHYLAKSFESLFGSVTCLPGCFSMYRLRSTDGTKPLLINNQIITDYSTNIVATLHMKNLLHLGEDRYLTTLMLKHFPFFKMKFTPDAKCLTNAPDTFSVLLSQRRRWINSTVHNLMELVFLPRLCGFCCFSMRFVVFMDLFSTIVMPAMLIYLGYIVYRLVVDGDKLISLASMAFLLLPYGLQMVVFLIRRQWQHIGWMFIYLCALPVFAFYIPIYSFWHFDDFSWGNTRVVLGESGKKKLISADSGKFDPSSIPTCKWDEYERAVHEPSEQSSSRMPSPRSQSPMSQAPLHYPPSPGYPPQYQSTGNLDMNTMRSNYSNLRPSSQMSLQHPRSPSPRQANFLIPMSNLSVNDRSRVASPQPRHSPSASQANFHPNLPPFYSTPGYPSANQLIDTVRYILSQSDLMQVSKRQLREKVDQHYQLDVSVRYKEFVSKVIELIIQDEL